MIEVMNIAGTKSIGRFSNMKAATPTLDNLRAKGELPGPLCPVRVSSFRGQKLTREYIIIYTRNKWRIAS